MFERSWKTLRSEEGQFIAVVVVVFLLLYSIYDFETFLSPAHKMFVGWGILAIITFFFKSPLVRKPPRRILFMFVGGFLTARYFFWRTLQTLQYTGPLDFIAMMILYLAECYAISIHFMGMFINATPQISKIIPMPEDRSTWPTVDVLIPAYTEPEDMVGTTAMAATQLDYPKDKLRIHICDDGSTIGRRNNPATSDAAWERYYTMRKIADRIGVNYITRERNDHAKAGNINHAMDVTSADLILILDCDHVPTHDFLINTVGSFLADPKLYLVQTPHFFINPTPIEKNFTQVTNLSVENDMFFRTSHPGFNGWNASYFCGSAGLLRRKYLEEVGGLCGETITEDAETSIVLHSKGYNSVYIRRPMVCGLSPESFSDYLTQRVRWAQGMIQLFTLRNPLNIPGLTVPQRIVYFNCCFFWFFGIPRFTYFVGPSLFLLFNLKVYHASVYQVITYALPHLFSTFFLMDFLYGRTRKMFFSEIYESVQSLFLLPAIISVILSPRKPTFKITPKGALTTTESLSPLAMPFTLVIAINIIALIVAGYKWVAFPLYRDVIVVTGSWCVYNSFIVVLSLGAFWEKKQIRNYHRINVPGTIDVMFPRMNQKFQAILRDISLSGIGFEVEIPFAPTDNEAVTMIAVDSYKHEHSFSGTVPRVRKIGENKYFMGSSMPISYESYGDLVSFVYGDSKRWVDVWYLKSEPGNTWLILSLFFKLGLKALLENVMQLSKIGFMHGARLAKKGFDRLKNAVFGPRQTVNPGEHADVPEAKAAAPVNP
ncbi:MAG: UDP-forming cellulose synthase catalytic subunit [Nitrospinae bacterium]|nr:UDP-forming cellulose synthase catalytic subunit [Nitrospinota bacterium]